MTGMPIEFRIFDSGVAVPESATICICSRQRHTGHSFFIVLPEQHDPGKLNLTMMPTLRAVNHFRNRAAFFWNWGQDRENFRSHSKGVPSLRLHVYSIPYSSRVKQMLAWQ